MGGTCCKSFKKTNKTEQNLDTVRYDVAKGTGGKYVESGLKQLEIDSENRNEARQAAVAMSRILRPSADDSDGDDDAWSHCESEPVGKRFRPQREY